MPTPNPQADWHVELGGIGYRLALTRAADASGEPRRALDDEKIQYPAPRFSEEPGYGSWPSDREGAQVWRDFSGGYGHAIWRRGQASYRYATGVDASIPGKLILAPRIRSQSLDGGDRITDQFERHIDGVAHALVCGERYVYAFSDPTDIGTSLDMGAGRVATSAATFQGSAARERTFVAERATGGMPQPYHIFDGTAIDGTWTRDAVEDDVAPSVAVVEVGNERTTDDAPPITLTLDDLPSANGAIYVGGLQPFEGLELTFVSSDTVNDADATVTVAYWDDSAWTAVSGLSDGTLDGAVSCGQEGSITWTLPDDWAIREVATHAAYFVRLTWSADLGSQVELDDIDLHQRDTAAFFEVHDTRLYRIADQADGWVLYTAQDGGDRALWQRVGTVTDLGTAVTAMVSVGTRLYILTERAPHVLAGDGASIDTEIWPHDRTLRDPFNGIGAAPARGQLWVPARRDLYTLETDPFGNVFVNDTVGPGRLEDNDTPVAGRVTCVGGDDYALYAVIQNADGASYLLKRPWGQGVWHSLHALGAITCRAMWVSDVGGDGSPVLYFEADGDLRWFTLPRNGPDPTNDPACEFHDGQATFWLGRFATELDFEPKLWMRAQLLAEALETDTTVRIDYRTTDDGPWLSLPTFDEDPGGEADFVAHSVAKFIELRLVLAGTVHATPVVRQLWISYAVRYPDRSEFRLLIEIRDEQKDRNGSVRPESARDLLDSLAATMASTSAVTLLLPDVGQSYDVIPVHYQRFLDDTVAHKASNYFYYAVLAKQRATARGVHSTLATSTHGQLMAYPHAALREL